MNRRLKNKHLDHQVEKLLSQKPNPHKYHQTIRDITGTARNNAIPPLQAPDGNIVTDDEDKAAILIDHFATQSTLHIPDTHVPPPGNTNAPPAPTLNQIKTNEQEVLRILNSLDANKSTGPDGIPVKFLKLTAIIIANPLAQLFNKSLSLGIYPDDFKTAIVKPIFKKKGSPSDPTSYRPISILSALSKVL